ncbi:LexA family transcriptional regulator [uncultured Campylobacter sp.]|uniref:XRE family transcriptional regulator n=1 Tax=uncultured Campylobacter sp. TaxID=218934 RepID=UPI00261D56E9|nr:LexA family transcriptional regulator [uncultured Campylobacter sp.]
MDLAQKIKLLRSERSWTQEELAKRSGVSIQSIKRYETGIGENITTSNLEKIAKVFNVKKSYFLNDDESSLVVRKSFVSPANLKKSQKEQIAEDQIFIRKLSSAVGAGESVDIEGVEVYDTDVLVPFSRMLFNLPVNEHNIRCLKVVGYSMIPMLYPDSWVIARMGPSFDGDGLYIIDFGGNFMVKLLQKHPNGTLFVNSVNQEYRSYEIGPNDEIRVQIVGKVLRCVI